MPVQIIAGIVILDFSAGYLAHRALHLFPILWRFHQVHHSDDFVDVTTTYRTHPVETVWRIPFVIFAGLLSGTPPAARAIPPLEAAADGLLEPAHTRRLSPRRPLLPLGCATPNIPQN